MIIVGLTGTIASGKTSVLSMFKSIGAVTINADHLIHLLQQKDTDQTKALSEIIGDDILADDGRIDTDKLSQKIIKDPSILKLLEQVYYPTLKAMMKKLIKVSLEANKKMVVIEIPMLFEAAFTSLVDTTIVCSATDEISYKRALLREKASKEKLDVLIKNRLKDKDLVKLSKNIINTNVDIDKTEAQVVLMYADLLTMSPNVWPQSWIGVEDI